MFKETVLVKPHVLLLNKIDLADLRYKAVVNDYYKKAEGIENILYVNCRENINKTIKNEVNIQSCLISLPSHKYLKINIILFCHFSGFIWVQSFVQFVHSKKSRIDEP